MTRNLDENGLIRVGAVIKEGDILIGKITPKGETEPSPEEKLLRAIFGDKAGDVKDASLKASPGATGVVIDKKLFSRTKKDKASRAADKSKLAKLDDEHEDDVLEEWLNLCGSARLEMRECGIYFINSKSSYFFAVRIH